MIFQPPLDWKDVKGVFCGGCIERGEGSSFRAKAHAHNNSKDKLSGWICVRSRKRIGITIVNDDGIEIITKPSRTMWHEYAHILTPNHSHDDVWRNKMRELKQPLSRQYDKKQKTGVQ